MKNIRLCVPIAKIFEKLKLDRVPGTIKILQSY